MVRGKASAATIRREVLARLAFEPSLAVVPAREVLALVDRRPFDGVRFSKDLRGWVAVLDGRPLSLPKLPVVVPGTEAAGRRHPCCLPRGAMIGPAPCPPSATG